MRCPYCGVNQTEVLRTVFRRHRTYRYRKCQLCKARFRTQEKPVRWEGVDRKWPGTPPVRNGWKNHRVPALRGKCEIASCGIEFKQSSTRRHVDHIVPARLIRRLRAGNPDRRENLQCICGTCHGYKLQADHKLCMGDKLGYLEVRDPRITRESLDRLCRSGTLEAIRRNGLRAAPYVAQGSDREVTVPAGNGATAENSMRCIVTSGKLSRAKRVWAEVADSLSVTREVLETLIARGVLKLYDPRVTEKSLRNFCRRHGALINSDLLNRETRDWLQSTMDFVPHAGDAVALCLTPLRKHARVVRRCSNCGRSIRRNVFFRHLKGCNRVKSKTEAARG